MICLAASSFKNLLTELAQIEDSCQLETDSDRLDNPRRDLRIHAGQPSHFLDKDIEAHSR